MAIIGTLPITLTNGSTADATQVMSDFNFIVNQVNANANPLGTFTAPTGTSMNFFNATAPLGWAINNAVNDHTVWLNSAAGGTSGGATGYSAMFQAAWTSDGHALTVGELAVHNHVDAGHTHSGAVGSHNHDSGLGGSSAFVIGQSPAGGALGGFTLQGTGSGSYFNSSLAGTTGNTAPGLSINASNANIQNTGSGSAHSHTKTFNAAYVAAIVAIKS